MKNKEHIGGKFARAGDGQLWKFTDNDDGSFVAPDADYLSRLYFPLMNSFGMKSWVNPELKGDICTSFDHYLTPPLVTEEIDKTVSSRNCWISIDGKKPWSATGMSAWQKANKWATDDENSVVEGQPGIFALSRENRELKIASKITVFVPASNDPVEIVVIEVENKDIDPVEMNVTYSIPVFGRHADNFRDHRQVTTMFQRSYIEKYGVRIKPNIVHDENGHTPNKINYSVLGVDQNGESPCNIWVKMVDFTGEGGTLDNPEAIFKKLDAPKYKNQETDGTEAIGALQFSKIKVAPNEKRSFIIFQGISDNDKDSHKWINKFGSIEKVEKELESTIQYWQDYTSRIKFHTSDTNFDNWARWINYQVKARQEFGNSFLPDFSYGRGGRGWRDLWQDLLSVLLIDPDSGKQEIINNFNGVRIDGSNATIIGSKPGEFIADRNKVARTWCDHGAWPVTVVNFYLQQTGDYDILFTELPYWKDQSTHRSLKTDEKWNLEAGNKQLNNSNDIYNGTILEHLLVQQLSAFYSVGEHNILLLEGADWNDTYDMARENGESVGFYGYYGNNFQILADILSHIMELGVSNLILFEEILPLFDTLPSQKKVDYTSYKEKQNTILRYFDSVAHEVTGKTISVNISELIFDLETKSDHINDLIQKQEWINYDVDAGYYNGHYDNNGNAVDGKKAYGHQIDLTTQVMAIMNNVAPDDQIPNIFNALKDNLKDNDNGGLRLCKPFPKLDLNIGRITGFVYGNKEHGSKWMQQNIMLAYGLYYRGYNKLAFRLIQDAYKLSIDSKQSKIFPGMPSYFGPDDRGAYAWLTGSSAWLILTLSTQMFGVRGDKGNLCIEPSLNRSQFNDEMKASIEFSFQRKRILLNYILVDSSTVEKYKISKVIINGEEAEVFHKTAGMIIISRNIFYRMYNEAKNEINIYLKSE